MRTIRATFAAFDATHTPQAVEQSDRLHRVSSPDIVPEAGTPRV